MCIYVYVCFCLCISMCVSYQIVHSTPYTSACLQLHSADGIDMNNILLIILLGLWSINHIVSYQSMVLLHANVVHYRE